MAEVGGVFGDLELELLVRLYLEGRYGVIRAECRESDLAARVADALVRGCPEVVKYGMGTELDRIRGTRMGCEGKADILRAPLTDACDRSWAAKARSAQMDRRGRLHAPMGLDLGAESPEIIALSVLAEIQAVLSERKPMSLREPKGSMHA